MRSISRRQFIAKSAMGVPMAAFMASGTSLFRATPRGFPMGAMLFHYRDQLIVDFPGTLKKVYDAGYKVVEYYAPHSATERMQIEPLTKLSAKEVHGMVKDTGLRMVSSHYRYAHLKEHIDFHIEYAVGLGLEHMVIASNGTHKTLDSWKKRADEMNKLAEKIGKAGMKLGFHNHGNEFSEIDGVLVYDLLMDRLNPELIGGQLQVRNPAEILRKYPGRFLSLHLTGDVSSDGKWGLPLGQGVTDWKEVFTEARKSKVNYYFVEMDLEDVLASAPYLKKLKT